MAADNFDIQGKALVILMTCLVKYQYIKNFTQNWKLRHILQKGCVKILKKNNGNANAMVNAH